MFNTGEIVKALRQERIEYLEKAGKIGQAITALEGAQSEVVRNDNVLQMPIQKKKRRFSAASRRRISESQRLRWAARKQSENKVATGKRKKLHWTQRPQNKERVNKWMRKMTRIRRAA